MKKIETFFKMYESVQDMGKGQRLLAIADKYIMHANRELPYRKKRS